MIDWEIKKDGMVLEYLRRMPEELVPAVRNAIGVAVLKIAKRMKHKLAGEVLNRRSGALYNSVRSGVDQKGATIIGWAGLRGADKKVLNYAMAHEYGAVIPAHIIIQDVGKARLKFAIGGEFKFRKFVHIPLVKLPARSFLRSTASEMKGEVIADITAAAQPPINLWRALL